MCFRILKYKLYVFIARGKSKAQIFGTAGSVPHAKTKAEMRIVPFLLISHIFRSVSMYHGCQFRKLILFFIKLKPF